MLSSACMFVNVATPGTALQHRTKNPRLFWLPAALVGSDDFCLSPPPRLDSKGTRMMMMAGLMAYLFPRQRQGRHSVRKQSTSIYSKGVIPSENKACQFFGFFFLPPTSFISYLAHTHTHTHTHACILLNLKISEGALHEKNSGNTYTLPKGASAPNARVIYFGSVASRCLERTHHVIKSKQHI